MLCHIVRDDLTGNSYKVEPNRSSPHILRNVGYNTIDFGVSSMVFAHQEQDRSTV
jgi:hypothetical protein